MVNQPLTLPRSAASWLVVGFTIVLVALAGSGRVPNGVLFAPLVLLAAIGFFHILGELWLGVALIPVIATAVPLGIGTGTKSPIVAALIFVPFLVGIWVLRSVFTRQFSVVVSPINAPIIALDCIWILAYVYSNAVRPPLVQAWASFGLVQVGGMGVVIISSLALLLALNFARDPRAIKVATWGLVGLGVLGVTTYYLHIGNLTSFLSINGLYAMWVIALAYGQALYNRRLPMWARIGLGILVLAMLVKGAILEVFWFSGWAPELVVMVVMTFFRSRKAFIILMICAAIALDVKYAVVYDAVVGGAQRKGDNTRLDIWAQQLNLIEQYPLLGTGPGGYAVFNMNLFADSMFSMSTHSGYLDIIDETGIVGAVIFIWFMGTLFVVGFKARRRFQSGFYKGYGEAAFGGLCGVVLAMALGDWFIPFVYNQTIAGFRYTVHSWVYLGFLMALAALPADRLAGESPLADDATAAASGLGTGQYGPRVLPGGGLPARASVPASAPRALPPGRGLVEPGRVVSSLRPIRPIDSTEV